jgi:hypothetical protein
MRSRSLLIAVALAACGASEGSGTVAYAERDTYNIRLLDIATGASRLIDSGAFAGVTFAPDGKHVAYVGADRVMKVADRSGTITPLVPGGGGCYSLPTWLSSSSLTYCIDDSAHSGMMFVPSIGAPPRFVDTPPVVSPDGRIDAYVNARGDLILENIDGSDARVLVSSPDPTGMSPGQSAMTFTPDQQAVVVMDYRSAPGLHIVRVSDGQSIDVPGVSAGGTSFGSPVFRGASMFSPDGGELVMQSTTGLVAVATATGTTRMLAPFPDRISSGGAVFLDASHVLWVRVEDTSVGDMGGRHLTLHVAGPGPADDLVLDDPPEGGYWPSIAVSPSGVVALPCDVLLVRTDGTVLATNYIFDPKAASDILGITPDGQAAITVSQGGDVRYVGVGGIARDLVQAAVGTSDLLPPLAAYSPSP